MKKPDLASLSASAKECAAEAQHSHVARCLRTFFANNSRKKNSALIGVALIGVVIVAAVAFSGGDESATPTPSSSEEENGFVPAARSAIPEFKIDYAGQAVPTTADEALGGIDAIDRRFARESIPRVMQHPFTHEAALEYAKAMKLLMIARPKDIAWLKAIDTSVLAGIDEDKLRRIINRSATALQRLEHDVGRDIEHSVKHTREGLGNSIASNMRFTREGAQADETDAYQQQNKFTRANIVALRKQKIDDALMWIDLAEMLDTQLGVDSDWEAKRVQLIGWAKTYYQKVESVAASIRPPKDIEDAKLAKIAAKVLSEKITYERLIVNAPKRRESRTEYVVERNTVTKVVREWDEFQAATVEEANDGKFYIFYNDILYYHQGPHTVPKGKWVRGQRFRSAPILEENISK